jgi:hypothetical protein
MLIHQEANPLAVFGMRELSHCPPHFTPVMFVLAVTEKNITDWIYQHLEGRFHLGDFYDTTETGGFDLQKRVSFEIAGEASMFALILDTING